MRTGVIRCIGTGVLMLVLAAPGIALAGDSGKGCTFDGTWFGVTSPDDPVLTGWMVTAEARAANHGTNNLEYPTFDATLGGAFVDAARISTLRGAWERVGGNRFVYTMTGMGVTSDGTPVWVGKLSGTIVLSADCNSETITATLEVFHPAVSPFDGEPMFAMTLPEHFGKRAYVDLP
ncbi:MAG: hypothetical protein P8080_07595 [Gammaproteobacteria bacterium]